MSEQVKLNVHEFAEGWAVVNFTTPPQDDSQRYRWLDKTLHDWMSLNRHTIEEVRPVRFREKLVGLEVFYLAGKPEFHLDVDSALMEKHGGEYLEAVMADVIRVIATAATSHPIMALTNRREITTIVDRQAQKGLVMSLARFRPRISPEWAKQLDEWLASTKSGYFMVPLSEFK